jgi:2-iminoacetate synthase ThiH
MIKLKQQQEEKTFFMHEFIPWSFKPCTKCINTSSNKNPAISIPKQIRYHQSNWKHKNKSKLRPSFITAIVYALHAHMPLDKPY